MSVKVNRLVLSYFVLLLQNELSCKTFHENGFDLHENEPVGETNVHMNGFA